MTRQMTTSDPEERRVSVSRWFAAVLMFAAAGVVVDRVLPADATGQSGGALVLAAVAYPLIRWAITPIPLGSYVLLVGVALLAQAGYLWLAETGRVPAVADRVTLWVTAGLVVLLTAALAWSFVRRPRR